MTVPAVTASQRSRVLVVVLLALYGLVAGTVGGIAAARLAGYPGSPAVVPADDVPRASDGGFRGLTVPGIEQAITRAGYSCRTNAGGTATCTATRAADYDTSLGFLVWAGGKVASVTGTCRPIASTATVQGCGAFIGSVPGLLYPANASRARPAQDWASQNLGADTSTVIDGVYYALQLQPLLIVCAPAA